MNQLPTAPSSNQHQQEVSQAYLWLSGTSFLTHLGVFFYAYAHAPALVINALFGMGVSLVLGIVVLMRRWPLLSLGRWVALSTPVLILLEGWRLGTTFHKIPGHIFVGISVISVLALTWLTFWEAIGVNVVLMLGITLLITDSAAVLSGPEMRFFMHLPTPTL